MEWSAVLPWILLTSSLSHIIAPIYNMRIDIPDHCAGCQVEPETTGDRVRRSNLSL